MLGGSGGYIIGFVVAGALVGRLAELGWDRHIGGSFGAMILGEIVIFAIGLPWLMVVGGFSWADTIAVRTDPVPRVGRPEVDARGTPLSGRMVADRPAPRGSLVRLDRLAALRRRTGPGSAT